MKKKIRTKYFAGIILVFIGSTIFEVYFLLYPMGKNCITKQVIMDYENGYIKPYYINNKKNDITEIIIYTEPQEVLGLPLGCNYPILHTKDSLVISAFLDAFVFKWDGKTFYETTDSFENKIFFVKNKTVIGFTYCYINSTMLEIYTDKTGWIFPQKCNNLINCLHKFKPCFNPFIFVYNTPEI